MSKSFKRFIYGCVVLSMFVAMFDVLFALQIMVVIVFWWGIHQILSNLDEMLIADERHC